MDVAYSAVEALARRLQAVIDYLGGDGAIPPPPGTADLQQQIDKLRAELEALKGQIGGGDGSSLQAQIDALRAQHAADMQAVNLKLTSHDTRIAELEGRVNVQQGQITSLTTIVNNMQGQVADIEPLRTAVAMLQTQVAAHDTQINANMTAIAALRADVEKIEGPFITLQQNVAQNATDIKGLAARLDALENPGTPSDTITVQQFQALVARVTTNEGKIATSETNITALDVRVSALENQHGQNDYSAQIAALTTRVTTAEGRITNNTTDIQALGARVAVLEAAHDTGDVSQIQADLAALATRVTTNEGNIDALGGQLTQAVGQLANLAQTVTDHGNVLDQHTADIANIFTRLDAVEGGGNTNITALEKRVEVLESNYDTMGVYVRQNYQNIQTNTAKLAQHTTQLGQHAADIAALQKAVADLQDTFPGGAGTTLTRRDFDTLDDYYVRRNGDWVVQVTTLLRQIQGFGTQVTSLPTTLSNGWISLPNYSDAQGPYGEILAAQIDRYTSNIPTASANAVFTAINNTSTSNSRLGLFWTSSGANTGGNYKVRIYSFRNPTGTDWAPGNSVNWRLVQGSNANLVSVIHLLLLPTDLGNGTSPSMPFDKNPY